MKKLLALLCICCMIFAGCGGSEDSDKKDFFGDKNTEDVKKPDKSATSTPVPTSTPEPTATPAPTATPVPTETPKKEVTIDDIKASILKYLSIPRNALDSVDYAWIDAIFTADYAEEMKWSIENFPSIYKESEYYRMYYANGYEKGGFYMFSEVDATEDGAKVYEWYAYDSMSTAENSGFVAVYPDGKIDMRDVLGYGYGNGIFTKQSVADLTELFANE